MESIFHPVIGNRMGDGFLCLKLMDNLLKDSPDMIT